MDEARETAKRIALPSCLESITGARLQLKGGY
jgi:hypothetical protein